MVNSTFASSGKERLIRVALGYASPDAKKKFWSDIASHLASGYKPELIGNSNTEAEMKGNDNANFRNNPKKMLWVISSVTFALLA